MPRKSSRPKSARRRAPRRRRRASLLKRAWPSARARKRLARAFRRTPRIVQLGIALGLAAGLFLAINWIYQVARKPTELFFPVSGRLNKTPVQTWSEYAPLFRKYSTAIMSPTLLAALAQVEASGNPVAETYWRWSWQPHPFEVYRPASSAVGMYQLTNGTFEEARHLCIHDHRVVEDGPWDEWRKCWFNDLYLRVLPRDAIEMTSAYLTQAVQETLAVHRVRHVSLAQVQALATLIHLCGAGAGDEYVRRGLTLTRGQKCGDQNAAVYLERVRDMQRLFEQLAQRRAARAHPARG